MATDKILLRFSGVINKKLVLFYLKCPNKSEFIKIIYLHTFIILIFFKRRVTIKLAYITMKLKYSTMTKRPIQGTHEI
jgi:hypothetical protein